tara:strand:+ start:3102 stop:3473 length:372 start_codon:yes stop_codon:yes gene_type:complete
MSYISQINELQERFQIVKMNNNDSSQITKLEEIKRELFFLKNEVEQELEKSYSSVNGIIKKINVSEAANVKLRRNVDGLKDENAGSIQLYDDIQLLYNQRLLGNWLLVFVISSGVYLVMKKKI